MPSKTNKYPFDAEIIRSARKTITLILQPEGKLIVRVPLFTTQKQILTVLDQKADWIQKKRAEMQAARPARPPRRFVEGEQYLYLGEKYPLVIVPKAAQPLALDGKFLLHKKDVPRAEAVFTAWYKNEARRVLTERTTWYASRYHFIYQRIRISSAHTRWGSCSSLGTLSFTWRLVMAPLPVIDYVVVHELVHTLEHNHQKTFWERVRTIMPDYAQRRAWLKANGQVLNLNHI